MSQPYTRNGLLVRLVYLLCALFCALLTGFGRLRRGRLVVLCYHAVTSRQKARFAWQMRQIRDRATALGTEIGPVMGRGRWPQVSVTFDDVFADLLDNALPVLEQHQIPATLFAVGDNLGCLPRWEMPHGHPESAEVTMTAVQLGAVSKNPLIRIGSHTSTHPDLVKIGPDRLGVELGDSRRHLEQMLATPIEDLALPYGSYDETVLRAALEAGYRRIYTVDAHLARLGVVDPVRGRFSMSPDTWRIEFLLTCCGAYGWLYPWRQFVRSVRRTVTSFLGK